MYKLFYDLALDLSTSGDLPHAKSDQDCVVHFMKHVRTIGLQDCIHKEMYVHLLIDPIPQWMVLSQLLLELGYGLLQHHQVSL